MQEIRIPFMDSDIVFDILETYRDLRETLSVKDAEQRILEDHKEELEDIQDRQAVWIGLARAEIRRKELTQKLSSILLDAREELLNDGIFEKQALKKIFLQLEDEKYRISDEEALIVPKEKKSRAFRTEWNIGDVYGFKITEEIAKEQGIWGKWCLMWTANKAEVKWPQRKLILPLVYLLIWDKDEPPHTVEELQGAGYIQVYYHRSQRKDKEEYRLVVYFPSKKVYAEQNLRYFGNFPITSYPSNELYIDPNKGYLYKQIDIRDLGDEVCYQYGQYGIIHPELAAEIEPPRRPFDTVLFTDYTKR